MSGKGKYTTYAPEASEKNTLLKKLFGKNAPPAALPPQMKEDPGKETDVRAALVTIAKDKLLPTKQAGDLGHFPDGVKLNFSDAPKTEDVKWAKAGDPANAYAPDITSPGPGKTAGADKSSNPDIKTTDLKPVYVAKGPDTGTKSPADTTVKVVESSLLGESGKLGSSDGKA